MTLLSLVLFIAIQSLLANYAYASSECRPLNSTMFNDCIKEGYNVSGEFTGSQGQHEISSLIASMQKKFKNCSSVSTLISCSIHLPKCSTASSGLPLTGNACRNFVRDCQNGSQEIEGLIALFRGLCEVLSPNTGANDDVKCKPLNISQCAGAGYDFTIVSREYQKIVESNPRAIFQDSGANSTLRKIICMELAPPCDDKNKSALLAPCKSTCHAAHNHSKSQFLKIFKNLDYCSVLPVKKSMVGKEICAFQAWPGDNAGYWPSNLWTFLGKAGTITNTPSTTTPPGSNSTSNTTTPPGSNSTSNTTTPPGSNTTSGPTTPTGSNTTSGPTTPPGSNTTSNTTTPPGSNTTSGPTTPTRSNTTSGPTTPTRSNTTSGPTTPTRSNTTSGPTTPTRSNTTSGPTTPTGLPASTPGTTTPTGLPASTPGTTTPTGSTNTSGRTTPTGSTNIPSSTTLTGSTTTPGSTQTTLGSKGGPGIQAKSGKKLSAGAIAGIVLGVLVIVAAIAFGAIFFRKYIKTRAQYRHSLMVDMDEL